MKKKYSGGRLGSTSKSVQPIQPYLVDRIGCADQLIDPKLPQDFFFLLYFNFNLLKYEAIVHRVPAFFVHNKLSIAVQSFIFTIKDISKSLESETKHPLTANRHTLKVESKWQAICINNGGFHLHLLVFPFVYQLNSGVLVHSSFGNDQFRRISAVFQHHFKICLFWFLHPFCCIEMR